MTTLIMMIIIVMIMTTTKNRNHAQRIKVQNNRRTYIEPETAGAS
jgi:hypothetical protein